jgi:hypothetical protein
MSGPVDAGGRSSSGRPALVIGVTLGAGLCFLPVASAIGMGDAFWIFAAVCALAFAFASRYVPETKGRTFSEIGAELQARWGREHAQQVPAY